MPPAPKPDDLTRPFWDAVRRGELTVPECVNCGRRHFVPEPLCPHCGAGGWQWAPSPGVGVVYSVSVVHQTVSPDQPVPFALAAVDLDDGWTMLTHIVNGDPEQVRIGDRVVFHPTRFSDEFDVPTFARTDAHSDEGT